VLGRVAGLIDGQPRPDGSTAWSGTFTIPPGQRLGGGDYTLRLDDGTSPGIRLGGVAAGPSLPTLVPFEVSGSIA
jgi:hypothetical protein